MTSPPQPPSPSGKKSYEPDPRPMKAEKSRGRTGRRRTTWKKGQK
jgi:hypothetical protein